MTAKNECPNCKSEKRTLLVAEDEQSPQKSWRSCGKCGLPVRLMPKFRDRGEICSRIAENEDGKYSLADVTAARKVVPRIRYGRILR